MMITKSFLAKEKKGVQFNEEVDVKVMETLTDEVEIDEVSEQYNMKDLYWNVTRKDVQFSK